MLYEWPWDIISQLLISVLLNIFKKPDEFRFCMQIVGYNLHEKSELNSNVGRMETGSIGSWEKVERRVDIKWHARSHQTSIYIFYKY